MRVFLSGPFALKEAACKRAWTGLLHESQALNLQPQDGKLSVDAVPDTFQGDSETDFLAPEFPAAWQSFSTIRLTFDEAKVLQRELAELWGVTRIGARRTATPINFSWV